MPFTGSVESRFIDRLLVSLLLRGFFYHQHQLYHLSIGYSFRKLNSISPRPPAPAPALLFPPVHLHFLTAVCIVRAEQTKRTRGANIQILDLYQGIFMTWSNYSEYPPSWYIPNVRSKSQIFPLPLDMRDIIFSIKDELKLSSPVEACNRSLFFFQSTKTSFVARIKKHTPRSSTFIKTPPCGPA